MANNKIMIMKSSFDSFSHTTDDGVEYWLARELQTLLGYVSWDKFTNAIERAMVACDNSKVEAKYQFRQVGKLITHGKGGQREIPDYMLTRYACYLIAQNGDPKKEEIAFAQSYFALQTRKQELIEERMLYIKRTEARDRLRASEKRLSENIYMRGVDERGFGRIRSKGDEALFGGYSTQDMKDKYDIKDHRPLADFLPAVTIAAKNLAAEMTSHNVEINDLYGEQNITSEHIQNNKSVRGVLGERGIKPENLPPSEDILKLERKLKRAEKKLADEAGRLNNVD